MAIDANKIYKYLFPKSSIANLYDFQKETIERVLNGNNTLAIIPTGGGKSLIYWTSGLALKGISIVISPLIALIDEQSEKLRDEGYETLVIHGGIAPMKQIELLVDFYHKRTNPHFLFVSPERIATDGFFEFCIKHRKEDVKLIVLDEIHCVSQWGFSFRPFYKRIPDFLKQIFNEKWPIILGLTATINPKDVNEICDDFKIKSTNILKDELLLRHEIELKVLKFITEEEKEDKLWELINIHKDEKILVYLYRKYNKRGVEYFSGLAIERGYNSSCFHGDMSSDSRQKIIQSFKGNNVNIVFATNAFGMGIDIPDIRVVIHFMPPESIEQYYQEIGRAARDKKQACAYLLFSNKNIDIKKKYFIDDSFPDFESIERVHLDITSSELTQKTIRYFDNEELQGAFSYLIENNIITLISKGMTGINIFTGEILHKELRDLFDSTKSKGTITICKKNNIDPVRFSEIVYSAVVNNKVKLLKSFDKCLIINNNYEKIPKTFEDNIISDIERKRQYKHNLFDYLIYIINDCSSSKEFHQEIGRYLGVRKHLLDKIYRTQNGEFVRSKSELIIASNLFSEGLKYSYEKPLFYKDGEKPIYPDFTLQIGGEDYYWEHLGLIGDEKYDMDWTFKLDIYRRYFPKQLLKTYEGKNISESSMEIINNLKQFM